MYQELYQEYQEKRFSKKGIKFRYRYFYKTPFEKMTDVHNVKVE